MKLNRNHLLLAVAVVLLFLLLLPFRPYVGRGIAPAGLPPLVTAPAQTRPKAENLLDLNTATEEQLQALPGIGPVRANSIVNYRSCNGPFQSVEELTAVDGIDLGVLEPLRHLICVTIE